MSDEYIIALDQGTTSCRAVLVDAKGSIQGITQEEFTQYFPKSGWVEHDPQEIWKTQWAVFQELIKTKEIKPSQIKGIGITNQRETTVVWDKDTGKPVYNAIVWQDKRTAPICEKLKKQGLQSYVKQNTGLVIDSYFSGTKIKWILDHVDGASEKARKGKLLFGTIDTWLIWKLTKGKVHATDYSNVSRTMLYNIQSLEWDDKLLDALEIPRNMLAEIKPSAGQFGSVELDGHEVPICGVAGDQQSALFGQACFEPGTAKNTYGTGCFLLMNTGTKMHHSHAGLITTLACSANGEVQYALEGSIFIGGAAVQWLRDGLRLIDTAPDSEYFAEKVTESQGVYVVPAFAGLGAPYWDMYARGAIFGLTRDTGKDHIIKATLQSIAYQTKDVLGAMQEDAGTELKTLNVDGGASNNDLLMQFQADILDTRVQQPANIEATAMRAAYLAGIATGMWTEKDIKEQRDIESLFEPDMADGMREGLYKGWKKAVKRTMNWVEEE